MLEPDAWVPLAEVARPHGVRGEVRLKLFNKDSDLLLSQDEVLVRMKDGEEHEVSIDRARRADIAILMKLHSVEDRDRAEELRGALICVRRRAFPRLAPGEFYNCDILGARVVLKGDEARELGEVKELVNYPSVDTLVVRATDGGKNFEVPLVEAFVETVDAAGGIVTLATLEGVDRS